MTLSRLSPCVKPTRIRGLARNRQREVLGDCQCEQGRSYPNGAGRLRNVGDTFSTNSEAKNAGKVTDDGS
jgi:hypothetical protein